MKKISFKVITLFPELIQSYLKDALLAKAIAAEIIEVQTVDLRNFSQKKYNSVDDTVFGGGDGMLLQCRPIELALESFQVTGNATTSRMVVYLSPQGSRWNAGRAKEFSNLDEIILICGRYAGIDQRFLHQYVDTEISLGDFVLSGGELAALAVIESVSRYIPGVLGHDLSAAQDSFEGGLLEAPQFTKPQIENGLEVPAVLLSGNHLKIMDWRKNCSILVTLKKRPDLISRQEKINWDEVKQFYSVMSARDKKILNFEHMEFPDET